MQQGYSPFKIARFFIERAAQAGKPLTPMKLIKLVYIAHGWSLALLPRPLISKNVQAWKYGPVIESLYHGFKHRGNTAIPKTDAESLPPPSDLDPQTIVLLEKVWEAYGGLTGIHLSSLTHQPGTPWYKIWEEDSGKNKKCSEIPNSKIEEFYLSKMETKTGSGH